MRSLRLGLLLLLLSLATAAHAVRFKVTTIMDNTSGSLREAIVMANLTPGRDTIAFDIDAATWGPGPWTLNLNSALPEITGQVSILGYTQPGSWPGIPGQVMIEIDHGSIPFTDDDFGAALVFVRGSERSVVSGLGFFGINARSSAAVLVLADDVRVSGNLFGLRADDSVVGLSGAGVASLMSRRTTIGGNRIEDGNLFAGIDDGILIDGDSHLVRYNGFGSGLFRTQAPGGRITHTGLLTGRIALYVPKAYRSMYSIQVQQNSFGLRDSTISDNHFLAVEYDGIRLNGGGAGFPETFGNRVENNRFGRDPWGQATFGVGTAIRLAAGARDTRISGNTVQGGNAGFVLLPRSRDSSQDPAGERNHMSQNRFFDLNSSVIGLSAGATLANDPLDADEGANRLQNSPELTFATSDGWLEGRLSSMPSRTYQVEVFLSASCHPSGGNVAERYLASFSVTTDLQGEGRIVGVLPHPPFGHLAAGDVLTATATDSEGNTSELSGCLALVAPLPVTLTLPRYPARVPAMDPGVVAKVQIAAAGAPSGRVHFSALVDGSSIEYPLGSALVVNGEAVLQTPAAGVLPQHGRYRIHAVYEGDRRFAGASIMSAPIVVFRPTAALAAYDRSSPVRLDQLRSRHEWLNFASGNWTRLDMISGDTYLGASRFDNLSTDQALAHGLNGYYTVDAANRIQPRSSAVLGGSELLTLLHVDGDARADALVRDPNTGGFALVQCLFVVDSCERRKELDLNPEWQWRGVGDFDGDGRSDLVFYDRSQRKAWILISNGDLPVRPTLSLSMPDLDAGQMAAADVNGDGFDDLALIEPTASRVELMLFRNGLVQSRAQGDLGIGGWSIPGAAHYALAGTPGYGIADLLLGNVSGEASLWTDLQLSQGQLTGTLRSLFVNTDYRLMPAR